MKKLLILLLVFQSVKTIACLNEFYTVNSTGQFHFAGASWATPFYKNFNNSFYIEKLLKLEKKLKKQKDYKQLSDYTVGLMKLGKPKEALSILIELYKHYPHEYIIAANLGTTYELNGQADSAYLKQR